MGGASNDYYMRERGEGGKERERERETHPQFFCTALAMSNHLTKGRGGI